jgi:hypothetical protein
MISTWRDDDGAFLFLPTYCSVISVLLMIALRMKYSLQYHHHHARANELVARLVTVSVKVTPNGVLHRFAHTKHHTSTTLQDYNIESEEGSFPMVSPSPHRPLCCDGMVIF